MATITLTEFCSECSKNKKMNRLMQTLGEESVFCKDGHSYPKLNAPVEVPAKNMVVAKMPEGELKKGQEFRLEKTGKTVSVKTNNGQEVLAETAVAVADPPPNLEAVESPFEVFDEERVEPEVPVKEVLPAEYPPTPMVEPPAVTHAIPEATESLPGGSIVLRVLIPDQYVSFLRATAESHGKTLEEYFSEIVEYGLSSHWFW